jgi:hypothetical protein
MSKESWREWEREPKEFLRQNYPTKRAWVKENLEVLNNQRDRETPRNDRNVINHAIEVTEDFARRSGINLSPKKETDVTHIPSRLEAIKRFERDTVPLYEELSLDKMIRILILAEAASVQESIDYDSSDVAQDHLNKLNELVRIHKGLTGGL